jgi:hypothetical protein
MCVCNVTLRRVRATIVAVEREISITYSECVFVALGIHLQCTCAMLLSVVCAQLYNIFPMLSGKRHYFQKLIKHDMCF